MKILHDPALCTACGVCVGVCPQQLLSIEDGSLVIGDEARCMGCFGCEDECHTGSLYLLRTPEASLEPRVEPRPELDGRAPASYRRQRPPRAPTAFSAQQVSPTWGPR